MSKIIVSLFVLLQFILVPNLFAKNLKVNNSEMIIKLKNGQNLDAFMENLEKKDPATFRLLQKKLSWNDMRLHKVKVDRPAQFKGNPNVTDEDIVKSVIKKLEDQGLIDFAEPNYIVSKFDLEDSNPGEVNSLSTYKAAAADYNDEVMRLSTSDYYAQSFAKIEVEKSWDLLTEGGDAPIVAVIDTGVDYNHDIFTKTNAIWINENEIPDNGIDDDNNGFIDDVRGWDFAFNDNDPMDDDNHGTHVAGIILGLSQNILAPELKPAKVKIMALKFLDGSGVGSVSDAIDAINYALDMGAVILNNSWGGPSLSQALETAILYSYEKKALFVAAAGNISQNNDQEPTYPANYDLPNMISVGATSDYDDLASFSNFGSNTVHIAAPGVAIYSSTGNNTMGFASGTSMSTPYIVGVAAMMKRENPELTGYQLKNIILDQASVIPSLTNHIKDGKRLNYYNALNFSVGGDIADYPQAAPDYNRTVASDSSSTSAVQDSPAHEGTDGEAAGGCGAVTTLANNFGKPTTPFTQTNFWIYFILFAIPFSLVIVLKEEEKDMNNAMINRRAHRRFDVHLPTQFQLCTGTAGNGVIDSLSAGGVRMCFNKNVETGKEIELEFKGKYSDAKSFKVKGEVVWSNGNSCGVKFSGLENTIKSKIISIGKNFGSKAS